MTAQGLVDPGEGKGRACPADDVVYAIVAQLRSQQDDLKRLLVVEEFQEVAVDAVSCIRENDEALFVEFSDADQKCQCRIEAEIHFIDLAVRVVNCAPVKGDVMQVRLVVVCAFETGNDLTVERRVAELDQALVDDFDAVFEASRAAFFDRLELRADFVEFRHFRVEFFRYFW